MRVLSWFREILLRPIVSCLETCGYWTFTILSWPLFRLWDGLQIVVYPLKECSLALSDACFAYLNPATKV